MSRNVSYVICHSPSHFSENFENRSDGAEIQRSSTGEVARRRQLRAAHRARAEHAVQRRVGLAGAAGDVGHHVDDRLQVLAVDDALARKRLRHDEFRQRHFVGLALLVLAAHLELQHRVQRAARGGGQADAHRHGVLAVAVVDRRDVLAGEREPRDTGHLGDRNAVQRGLGGVDAQDDPLRRIEDRIVDRGQVRRLLEDAAHLLRQRHLGVVIGAVDLGDDRRQHRRAGRHLDHLDVGAARPGDLLEGRTHRLRDLVALAVAPRLVDEVDLQVADFAAGAQVILAHQPVEADRRGESRRTPGSA